MDATPEPAPDSAPEPALETAPGTALLPPPPPPVTSPEELAALGAPPRAGQLTNGWNTVFWLGWAFAAGALIAVWVSSRTTGLSTWWIGPRADPRFIGISLLVFVPPIGLCLAGLARVRWLPWFGIAGGVALLCVAAGDMNRVPGYAVVEAVIAAGGLLISVACFAGMLRRA